MKNIRDRIEDEIEGIDKKISEYTDKSIYFEGAIQELRAMKDVLTDILSDIPASTSLNVEEQELCISGKKIQAIKSLRARTSLALKEAKDIVDSWCDQHRDKLKAYNL